MFFKSNLCSFLSVACSVMPLLLVTSSSVQAEEMMIDADISLYFCGREGFDGKGRGNRRELTLMFESEPGEVETIVLAAGNKSNRLHYRGPPVLCFFNETQTANGLIERTPISSICLPVAVNDVLLVAFPSTADGHLKVPMIPIDTSFSRRPVGTVSLFNVSGVPLACSVFDERKLLQPLDSMMVEISQRQLSAQFAIRERADWRVVCSQKQTVRKSRRYAFLMMPSGAGSDYRMVRISL